MKDLLKQVAATVADYRTDELPALDAGRVERWINQFDADEREPILRELVHIWGKIYIGKKAAVGFLERELENSALTGGDHASFWKKTEFLDIQERGHSQSDMLALLKPVLKAKMGLRLTDCGGGDSFLYIDDVLFTGSRITHDLVKWINGKAPKEATVYILLMAVHSFGSWRLEEDIKSAAKAAGKKITLNVFRIFSFENRKSKKDQSDVLWPTSLVPGAEMYTTGKTAFDPRNRGGGSRLFSSEAGRHSLEQGLLKVGLRIRSFCKDPKPILRPLGFGPFGVGFGSLFLSYRNCPNNAPLALWWGDPDAPAWHPFRRWFPLVPRKTYGDDDGF